MGVQRNGPITDLKKTNIATCAEKTKKYPTNLSRKAEKQDSLCRIANLVHATVYGIALMIGPWSFMLHLIKRELVRDSVDNQEVQGSILIFCSKHLLVFSTWFAHSRLVCSTYNVPSLQAERDEVGTALWSHVRVVDAPTPLLG